MQSVKMRFALLLAVMALGACSSGLSDEDRATLNSANQNAAAAQQQASQANATAQQALQTAQTAQSNAASANQKADRMFEHSMRK
jgi:GAF domain-containing protein